MEDAFGLPAFRYTLNQVTDPRAVTDVHPGLLLPTEHVHQVGNDRIVALASNYGHLRVRQDEGCPKLLNCLDPDSSQYVGGFGYLVDGDGETLTTYFDGGAQHCDRIFGVGYFRKHIEGKQHVVDHVVCAPFGDDPVLISQITISNRQRRPSAVRWIEYWGCQPFQFSYRSFLDAIAGTHTRAEWRLQMGRRFRHQVTMAEGNRGLLETKHFIGRSPDEEAAWQTAQQRLREHPGGSILPIPPLTLGTDFETFEIPPTFLVSLDAPMSGFSSNAAVFFGAGGAAQPDGLMQPLGAALGDDGLHTGLLIERRLQLEPGESRTVSFLYGYLPEGVSLRPLVEKYEASIDVVMQDSAREWKRRGMRLQVSEEPWIEREAAWNHYYLRSGLTFDSFFGEHILNQGGFYQYTMGFQGAARDPLQHCLPFLFSDPEIVKSVLRYTLKEVRDDGSIPYAIVGHGVIAPMLSDKASDLPLWLLWVASEYVLATRDTQFLRAQIGTLYSADSSVATTVSELLQRCYRHQIAGVGVGRHGLVRMLADDWNDGLIYTWAGSDIEECIETSESVMNSAMAAFVYDRYASMLEYAGEDSTLAQQVQSNASQQRNATAAQWNGKWFRRAWLGPKLGWLGESTLWIEPQPWAILSGAATESQSRDLVKTMNDLLRQGPLGATQMNNGPDMQSASTADIGTLELGAIWPSLNQFLVWAMAGIDPMGAWEEWKRNTLACHADHYPDLWYGVWSGNDSYNTPLSKNPGGAADESFFHGTDFPVFNLHAHACSLYSASKLIGIDFTINGLRCNLHLPLESYAFESPLVAIRRSGRRIEGWYEPSRFGTWTVELSLPQDCATAVSQIQVNGLPSHVEPHADGTVTFRGHGGPQEPLKWLIK